MKNRYLFVALFTLLFILFLTIVSPTGIKAGDTPTITVPTIEARPGEKVSVKLKISNNPGICTMYIGINYDSELTLIGASTLYTEISNPEYDSANKKSDKYINVPFFEGELFCGDIKMNPYNLSWDTSYKLPDNDRNGEFVNIEFVVNENASKGLHEISVIFPLEKDNIYNVWGISFDNEFKLEAGGIVVDGEPVKKQLGTPKFSIKKANSGKGVKLTVSKTKNATGFYLYYTDNSEVSLENLSSDDKDKYQVVKLKKDGTKKWTYTIKQLPKGTYKFMLVAINKEGDEQQSKEKTFKVKPKGKKK